MSYRYKSALLSLISLALIYGWYFANWYADRAAEGPHPDPVLRLGHTVLAVAFVQVVGHVIIKLLSKDRYMPMDERERNFDRRATSVGYYLLIVCTLAAIATLHLGASRPDLANAALAAIVISECVRQGVFVVLHHRAG